MPTKRNRKDSEKSVGSIASNCLEDDSSAVVNELSSAQSGANSSTSSGSVIDDFESPWQRPCCMPTGCVICAPVNLTEPTQVVKIICNNENCMFGPYMHKECFEKWEEGLLTYLRSHGRARSWSEKQRKQNLWTKKGYDLAYRACACLCGRGHLRKDLHWSPQDVAQLRKEGIANNEEQGGAKKKNRKKHKDLPALGIKYTTGMKSKSKPIPNNKDNRARNSSNSSIMSVDQGYSSASPASGEVMGGPGSFIFSPPHNNRVSSGLMVGNQRNLLGSFNSFLTANILPEIPDNDILQDFQHRASSYSSTPPMSPDESLLGRQNGGRSQAPHIRSLRGGWSDLFPQLRNPEASGDPIHAQQDHRFSEVSKMMESLGISKRPALQGSFDAFSNGDLHSPSGLMRRMRSISESTVDSASTPTDSSSLVHPLFDFDMHHDYNNDVVSMDPIGTFGSSAFYNSAASGVNSSCTNGDILHSFANIPPQQQLISPKSYPPSNFPHEYINQLKKQGTPSFCPPDLPKNQSEVMLQNLHPSESQMGQNQQFAHLLPENHISMMYNNIEPDKPQVIVIPGEKNNTGSSRTHTEIHIIPMCTTTFQHRVDFDMYMGLLQPQQVNPYHIKMEGEGYGSDDLRNFILSKLSRSRCSQMNCVICSANLPIYDHFPLLDGTMFLSPERNEASTKMELKMQIEHKYEYVHAVCIRCMEGVHNIVCRLCKAKWQGSFHQLGSLYMYDLFAAHPCCQHRLCCKQCGAAIVNHRVGLKYFSEYSSKVTCPRCHSSDYHFVHPTSSFQLVGLVFS